MNNADVIFERKCINLRASGENIRVFRERGGLTVIQLADLIGVSLSAVYHWEQGKAMPCLDHISNICEILGVPFGDIFVYD